MVYSLKELLAKLREEHNSSFYYRGQLQQYESPLWPSMYRDVAYMEAMEMPKYLERRCNRGNYFGFMSAFFKSEKYTNPEEIKMRELKRLLMMYARNALGYCLAEAMFQQAGWSSEGLDVTSNIDIAVFFATHRYINKESKYEKDRNYNRERIIYRWSFDKEIWDFKKLNKSNYYNCPALFPSNKILDLFGVCESIEEFERSVETYREIIDWSGFFDPTDLQGNRPYDVIKLPYRWKMNSRIVQQDASLIFPDTISLEEFKSHLYGNFPDFERLSSMGGFFVEDLSMTHNCEKFIFKIEPDDFDIINVNDNQVYIEDDISHRFLAGWMKSFFQNEYGFQKIMINEGGNYLNQLDQEMNFNPLRYRDNEELFNG